MKVVKKLYQYACLYKKIIIAALIMLSISVAADLAGPFVAKKVIDSHVLGIESPWYETAKSKDAVSYQDTWYKRGSYFADNEQKGQEVRILQTSIPFWIMASVSVSILAVASSRISIAGSKAKALAKDMS